MIRAAAHAIAVSVLAAACSAIPLPGNHAVQAQVTNTTGVPVSLAIEASNGVVVGAVQPALVPAGTRGVVTFHLPPGDDWWITMNGDPMFPAPDVHGYIRDNCRLFMEIAAGGGGSIGCS